MQPPCARLVRKFPQLYFPGRGERYARTIVNANQASSAFTSFLNEASGERRPRRTLRLHDYQRALRKPSVRAVALCSPCVYYVPHCIAQAERAETAAYAALARSPSKIFKTSGVFLRSHDPRALVGVKNQPSSGSPEIRN
jgi:polynucleotide 5'-kinase involved in rRNA processing